MNPLPEVDAKLNRLKDRLGQFLPLGLLLPATKNSALDTLNQASLHLQTIPHAEQQIDALNGQIAKNVQAISQLQTNNHTLRRQLLAAQLQLESMTALKDRVKQLTEEIQSEQSELARLKEQARIIPILQETIDEAQRKISAQQNRISQLDSQLLQLK